MHSDLFSACEARDKALSTVADNSDGYFNLALIELAELRTQRKHLGETFLAEQIRNWLVPLLGLPDPHLWGSITSAAIKRGIIQETGKWIAMTGEKSHARRSPEYRWA